MAVAMDDAGRRIDGIVVADPDRTDRSSGRHTMDERARQPALPVRLHGHRLVWERCQRPSEDSLMNAAHWEAPFER